MLSEQAVAETVKDYTDLERQQIVIAAQEAQGNPLYNQRELQRRKLTAQINEEFANAVLLPEEDPTVLAEQTRLQMLELQLIVGQGTQVPVSPRDNHLVHLGVIMPVLEQVGQAVTKDPHAVETLQALLKHAEVHYQTAEQAGAPKEALAPFKKTLDALRSVMGQLIESAEQEKQLAAAQAAPLAA